MSVQIPESYRAYCTDRAVRTAVEHILGSTKALDVPTDLKWDELPKFHKAMLSAHQVRCEYAIFLHELWNAVWQPAVDRNNMEFIPKTVADTEQWRGGDHCLDTYSIWNWMFARVLDIDDTEYVLDIGAYVDNQNRVRLTLYLWDQENDKSITNELDLGDWRPPEDNDHDDGYVYSSPKLAPIVNDDCIDLAPLHNVADAALATVEHHCQLG